MPYDQIQGQGDASTTVAKIAIFNLCM